RNSCATPDVNNRNAHDGANQRPEDVHLRQITDPAHPLQKGPLSTGHSPEKQDDGKHSNIGGMIRVPTCKAADPFASEEERPGTRYSKHQADPTEGEYGGCDHRLAARTHCRGDLTYARAADSEVRGDSGNTNHRV